MDYKKVKWSVEECCVNLGDTQVSCVTRLSLSQAFLLLQLTKQGYCPAVFRLEDLFKDLTELIRWRTFSIFF